MQFRIAVAATILIAASAVPAIAADFPARRAGLWTVSVTVEGTKMPTRQNRMCIDATTDAKMMKYGMAANQSNCSALNIQGSGNTRTVDSVCHIDGGTQKSHMVAVYQGDSSFHMDMQTTFAPPIAGRSNSHITQDAKWIGSCPADMKPGDMVMSGGVKINLMDSMKNPQGAGRLTPAQIQAIIKAHGGH